MTTIPFHFSLEERVTWLIQQKFDFLTPEELEAAAQTLVYELYSSTRGMYLNQAITYGRIHSPESVNGTLVERFEKEYWWNNGRLVYTWTSYMGEENPSVEWTQEFCRKQIRETQDPNLTESYFPYRQWRAIQTNKPGHYETEVIHGVEYHPVMLSDSARYLASSRCMTPEVWLEKTLQYTLTSYQQNKGGPCLPGTAQPSGYSKGRGDKRARKLVRYYEDSCNWVSERYMSPKELKLANVQNLGNGWWDLPENVEVCA